MKTWYRLPLPNNIIYQSQYIPLRCLIAFFRSLPVNAATRLGSFLGRLIWSLNTRHRQIARTNLTNALGDKLSSQEINRTVRRVYEHFGMAFVHMTHMNRTLQPHNWSKFVQFKNLELLDDLLKKKKGAILVGAHQGNWEVAFYALALAGYPVTLVAFRLLNPLVNNLVEKTRTAGQRMKVIYTKNAIEKCVAILNRGEIVLFLVDLTGRKQGLPLRFFNQTASTLGGPANLALKTQAPVVPFYSYLINNKFNYQVGFENPISFQSTGDKNKDIKTLAQKYTSSIENIIRRHPEQWGWFHRKWKKYRLKQR